MRLHIEHTTSYVYERPVTFGRHRLVLRPREGHDLRVERMQLRITPDHHLMWIRDVFGNSIALVDWLAPSDTLTIVSDVVVERVLPFPARAFHEPWRVPFPPQYDPMEVAITSVYQSPAYVEDAVHIQAWLGELATDPHDAEGSMLALCMLVHRTISYQRRLEKGVQSPARTLELRSGSCRDMATLMMEAARHLGVAARFSSGYLHGSASLAGRASTHAWTEVYLPTLGWRGFDPTLGTAISLRHIVTGVSSHPRGVMPVSGAFTGTRADCKALHVTVKTEELPELDATPTPVG
jgi:transglutaminase-like putative cysteine protease